MSSLNEKPTNRIFNSIEEAKVKLGWDVIIPKDLPEGCNMVRYDFKGGYCFYKTVKSNLYFFTCNNWLYLEYSLEDLIDYEESLGYYYVTIQLSQKDDKYKFTPDCLLGVATDHGYITDVGLKYITTTGYNYCEVKDLKFYISDENDETVTFDEYVDMFYER